MNFILATLAAAIIFPSISMAQNAIAVINNKTITVSEFNTKYEDVVKQTLNPPTKEQFLEDLVRFEIGVQEAETRELRKDPIVQERVRQELYKALLEKEIGNQVQNIKVSEKEMQDYYKNNPELRTSHVLISFKLDATKEEKEKALARAGEIYDEVKKSKRPFEELVKLYSDDSLSKQNGGDVGYQSRLTLVPQYYDTALKLKVNQIHGLIETQYGYHIIKLTGRRNYKDANKRQLRAAVFDSKRKQIFDNWFAAIKKKYAIKVFKDRIEK